MLMFHSIWICCRQGRGMPLMMDPGLYKNTKSDLFWVNPNRGLPTAFRLFTGQFSCCTHDSEFKLLVKTEHIAFCRIGLDDAVACIRGVLHMGMGKSSKNSTHVLHEFRVLPGRILSDSHLQCPTVHTNSHQPWHALHILGQSSSAASSHPKHKRHSQHHCKWCSICQKVQEGWPSVGQDWQGVTWQDKQQLHTWWLVWRWSSLLQGWGPHKTGPRAGRWEASPPCN